MRLRAASPADPRGQALRAYLEEAAANTGTHADDLIAELGRWVEMGRSFGPAIDDASVGEYTRRYGGSTEETKVRVEGFRQVTGVLPSEVVAVWEQAGGPADVLDMRVVIVPPGD